MAGRPRSRAKAAAEEAERAQALLAQVHGAHNETMRRSAARALAEIQRPAAVTPNPTFDRAMLAEWWREHVAEIERTSGARRELLATASEHPSPIYAKFVKVFGMQGLPQDLIATLLEMSEADLQLHYGAEYLAGSAEVMSLVTANVIRMATSGNDRVAAKVAVEYLNRRGGEEWRAPAQKLEVEDSRKPKAGVIDSSAMSYEDRQLMREIILRTTGRAPGLIARTESTADTDSSEEA